MINGKDNPVEWAMMSYSLEEVIEHLQELSNLVIPDASIDEEEFQVYMGHIYIHLNRLWNQRNHVGDISNEQIEQYSKFPEDIKFYG